MMVHYALRCGWSKHVTVYILFAFFQALKQNKNVASFRKSQQGKYTKMKSPLRHINKTNFISHFFLCWKTKCVTIQKLLSNKKKSLGVFDAT